MPVSYLRRLVDRSLDRLALMLGARMHEKRGALARMALPAFATEASGLVLHHPFELRHPERMYLGTDIKIGPGSSLKLITTYPRAWMSHPLGNHVTQTFEPELHIGDRVTATGSLYLTVYERVTIEEDVLVASNVYISDGSHAVTRGDRPYKYQGIERVAPVHVGRGAWIGQNVVILPGVTIGPYAVIGANAVVTADVPGGTIAVGAPARIVRRWDAASDAWVRVGEGRPASQAVEQEVS